MSVKIRLTRHGKKNYAFFHIVVADSRAPRDGRFIEQIGSYNPNTNSAVIELDSEKALDWLNKGAQPSDTCRRILSYEGVLLKKHLQGGVAKGALTEEAAQQKWDAWKNLKDTKVASKKQNISSSAIKAVKDSLDAEAKVNQERADAIAKRKAEEERKKADAAAEAAKAAEAAAAAIAAEKAEKAEKTETPEA